MRLRAGSDHDCEQCRNYSYFQPFDTQPLRFVWWLDEALHRRHAPHWLQRWTCDYVERHLWGEEVS